VIGTGAGGGTLAYHLANAGENILILEHGPFSAAGKIELEYYGCVPRKPLSHQRRMEGQGRQAAPSRHWILGGGNTKVYGAALFRLRRLPHSP